MFTKLKQALPSHGGVPSTELLVERQTFKDYVDGFAASAVALSHAFLFKSARV